MNKPVDQRLRHELARLRLTQVVNTLRTRANQARTLADSLERQAEEVLEAHRDLDSGS